MVTRQSRAFTEHGVVDDQDRVFGGDTGEQQETDQRRQRQGVAGEQQHAEGATAAERHGREDHERQRRAVEEQQQHHIDGDHPGEHRQREADEQLDEGLRVARGHDAHTRRQVAHLRQRHDLRGHITERTAVELGGDRDIALAIDAVDARRSAARADVGDGRQGHRAARARHPQLAEHFGIGERDACELHADRYLALREVQLGEPLTYITARGDARRVRDVDGGDAEIGRARRVGTDDDLWSQQRRGGADRAEPGQ